MISKENFVETFGPLNEDFLKTLEMYLDINFPSEYRFFLRDFNGGKTGNRGFSMKNDQKNRSALDRLFGFVPNKYNNILLYLKNYKDRIPQNTFPIGYDPFGNLILISVKNKDRGKIYFWDHEMEADEGETPDCSNLTLIADSFDEFIEGLDSSNELSDDI